MTAEFAPWWEWVLELVGKDRGKVETFHDYPTLGPREAKSPEWIARRRLWVREWLEHARTAPTCLVCDRDWTLSDDLHHVTYLHLGEEHFNELVPLCQADHASVHELFESDASYLRAGRMNATTLAIRQLRECHATERMHLLIAESEGE